MFGSVFGIVKENISTISKFNYWEITREWFSIFGTQEGTSPGVMASFNMISNPLIGFIVSMFPYQPR